VTYQLFKYDNQNRIYRMSHSVSKIWIHAIWSTKYRIPFINAQIEKEVYLKIKQEFKSERCVVRIVNGMPDHIHCLFLLNRNKSISQVMKQVKGSTSRYINEKKANET
jgi:putative transposase